MRSRYGLLIQRIGAGANGTAASGLVGAVDSVVTRGDGSDVMA